MGVKKNKASIYVAMITGMITLLGFSWIIIKNDSILLLYGDSFDQKYAFLMGFWQKIHDLDFNLFEWSNGLGSSTYAYLYYNLLSPFNLIFYVFPKEAVKYLILYVDIFKMMLLAAFSCKWLNKIFKVSTIAMVGSLMIAFSGWIFFYYQYHFLDAFLFYPLILYFTECFIQDKKKIGLVSTIAVLTFVNYYFMYMFVPFLWLYALFRYLIIYQNIQIKKLLFDGGTFLILTFLGMGIAGIVLLPSIYIILMVPRLSASQELSLFIGKNDLFRVLTSLFSPIFSDLQSSNFILDNKLTYQGWNGGAPLYTSIFTVILMPHIIKLQDKRKRNILLVFIGIIGFFIICPYFYKLFHATIDTRFFYMFTFLAVYCNCEVLNDIECLKGKMKFILFGLLIIAFGCSILISYQWQLSTIALLLRQCKIQVVLFILLLIGLVILNKKGIKIWTAVVCLEMLFCTLLFVRYNDFVVINAFNSENDEIIDEIKINDDGFYRVLKESSKYNDAFINQVNGVNFYSTIYGFEQDKFLDRLKFGDDVWSVNTYTNKYRIYNLIGVKYWYSLNGDSDIPLGYKKVDQQDYYINTNFIELGYAVSQVISSDYVFSLPYLLQDRIMQEYLVIDESNNIDYELNDNCIQIVEWQSNKEFELVFDEPLSDAIIYVENFGMPSVEIDLYENDERIKTSSFLQFNYVDYYINKDMNINKVVIRYADDLYTGSSVNVYVASNASLTEEELYQKRIRESFENVVFDGDQIYGNINLSRDSYIFTQIPYDSGWKAYSDNVEVEVIKANGGFCAIYLPEGAHEVSFVYEVPWFKEGMMISLASFAVCAIWFCIEQKSKAHSLNRKVRS